MHEQTMATSLQKAAHLCVKDICALSVPEQEAPCLRVNVEELGVPSAMHKPVISVWPDAATCVAWDLHISNSNCDFPSAACSNQCRTMILNDLVDSVKMTLYFSGCPLERTTVQDVLRLAEGSTLSRPGLLWRDV